MALESLRDFSAGQVNEVVDALLPTNAMRLILNMDTDVLGGLRVRKGTTAIGNKITDNKVCLGLYNFRDSGSGTYNRQLAVFNNAGDTNAVLSYNNAGTWTAVGGGSSFTASKKLRFETFLDYTFMVSSAFLEPKSWNGDTATDLGTTHLMGAPSGQFINVFKSRLYIAGTSANPDRLYFSTIPDISGNITWDTTNNYLDVNPSDGMNITGLVNTGTLMLIFKERAMYRWNGSATDANLVVDVGTTSNESLATRNGAVFFFNPYGIYITDGGYPVRISRPIERFIKGMSASFYGDVVGVCDDDHYYCSIGDTTVDGVTYTNVVLVYTISTKTWTVRSYPERIRAFANFIGTSGEYGVMCGNDDGDVQEFNAGSTDDGTAIQYRVKTKKLDFGAYSIEKSFSDVMSFGDGLVGAQTIVTVEDGSPRPQSGGLFKWFFRESASKYRGRYFIFELTGQSVDGQGVFEGWEILDLKPDGIR